LKFPNFVVAPSTYVERKKSSQEQVEKPEKMRFYFREKIKFLKTNYKLSKK